MVEQKSAITFPQEGVRAVNVPLESIEFRPDSGVVRSLDSNYNGEITELDGGFQKIRSMLIFSSVDCRLEGVYDEPLPLQAGWNPIQNMPAQEQFKLDMGALAGNLDPAEAQLQVYLFNTSTLPVPVDSKKVRATNSVSGITIDSTSWTTVLKQPSFPFDNETLSFSNDGSNDLEFRVLTYHGGKTRQAPVTASGSRTATLAGNDPDEYFNNSVPAEMIELQARIATSGNSTKISAEFTGEN